MQSLTGRERELATLHDLLAAACDGRGGAAVVLGEPGIGKTSVAEALADGADPAMVGWGRCSPNDAPAFWPWRQALRGVGITILDAGADDDTTTVSRADLFARVVDEIAATEAPLLLLLDDIHWADPATLALIRFVVDAARDLSLMLVVTARDDPIDATPDALDLLHSLPSGVHRQFLTGLPADATAAVITDVLGRQPDAGLVDHVAARCGGNPYFIREVARLYEADVSAAASTVPGGVKQLLGYRLDRIESQCRELLTVAAVAGEPDIDLLARASDRTHEEVLRDLADAEATRLIVRGDDGFRFAHALVRETIDATLTPELVAAVHRRVAEALDGESAHGRGDLAARLALHWRHAAGADARPIAARRALAAAREARRRMGYEQAVRYYRWALDDPSTDRIDVLAELGEAEVLAGELNRGRETLVEAAELARAAGRFEELARAVLWLGGGIGGFEVDIFGTRQVELLEDALAGLPHDDSPLRAAALARLSLARTTGGEVDERIALADEAVAIARRVDDPEALVACLAASCDAIAGPEHIDERIERSAEMLSAAERARDPLLVLLARRIRLVALLERGDVGGVDAEIMAYERAVQPLRAPLYEWPVPVWRGMRALMDGNLDEVERWIGRAAALGEQAQSVNADLAVLSLRMALALHLGRARDVIDSFDWDETIKIDPYLHAGSSGWLAIVGRTDDARRLFPGALRTTLSLNEDSEWISVVWTLAEGAILLDEVDAAAQLYERMEPHAHVWRVESIGAACLGMTALILGRLAGFLGRRDDAERWLSLALDGHRAAGAALLVEQTEAAIAELGMERDVAQRASPAGADEGAFRRHGKVWQLLWRGVEATAPDSKGMRDLAALLALAGDDVAALDLVEAAGGPPAAAAGGHTGEQLDATARQAYRGRLEELEDEIADAEANADIGRIDTLRHEQDFIVAELTGALGLGGRPRTTGEPAERARKAVTMRIRTAVRAIGEVHPDLAVHLDRSVTTGRFCAYRPERDVRWHL